MGGWVTVRAHSDYACLAFGSSGGSTNPRRRRKLFAKKAHHLPRRLTAKTAALLPHRASTARKVLWPTARVTADESYIRELNFAANAKIVEGIRRNANVQGQATEAQILHSPLYQVFAVATGSRQGYALQRHGE